MTVRNDMLGVLRSVCYLIVWLLKLTNRRPATALCWRVLYTRSKTCSYPLVYSVSGAASLSRTTAGSHSLQKLSRQQIHR